MRLLVSVNYTEEVREGDGISSTETDRKGSAKNNWRGSGKVEEVNKKEKGENSQIKGE